MSHYRKDPGAVARLTPEQFRVTQRNGTEPAFRNEFWDAEDAGIYVDVVSGEPLFASVDKFDSRTGWPSFTRPIDGDNVALKRGRFLFAGRTEVRSTAGDSHLGHVFHDGPTAEGGLRYCINSAALRFVPLAELEDEGYGAYAGLFDDREAVSFGATERAILAGGCFWGAQQLLRRRPGIVSTRVGYSGGTREHATYRHHEGHAEAVEVVFDPGLTSYRELLEFFFQIHDPSTKNRQGNDVGASYRSAIFYTSDEQKRTALDTIADVDASGLWPGKVVTEVTAAGDFWEAEEEHQDYLEKDPYGYTCHYVRPGWRLPKRADAVAG
jgi:methionine-R-sulfoxide reductase/methionine-S-sulfoxide reductase